jgi:soluble lytic murein transglycosylase-like protein
MTIESGFNVRIKSPTGAHGLMQLIIGTANIHEKVTVENLYNPVINIRIGIKEYVRLVKIFNGDKLLALLGYNRGTAGAALFPKNVAYLEDEYVQKIILSNYHVAQLFRNL